MKQSYANKKRIKIMRSILQNIDLEDKVILEIGPGPHPTFKSEWKCKKIITIDIQKKHKPTILADVRNGIELKSNTINLVIAGEVIEHLYDSVFFLKEIHRVLQKNGYLLLSCPNVCSLGCRIDILRGRIPAIAAKADNTYEDDRIGHVRDYNFNDLRKILIENGFRILKEKTNSKLPKTLGKNIIIFSQKILY